ncbi:MAG: hypothetical protein ACLFSB_14105 [Chitinispirillaceae bacterium]
MSEQNIRKPISNFFIKRSIQFSIIGKTFLIVLISVLLTTVVLSLVYNAQSQGGSFYYMSNNIMEDLALHSLLGLILPALIVAQTVTILIAIGIGLFSSRKVAVPIYKIEKWASQLKQGKLNTHLAFREQRQMRDLTVQCNAAVDKYCDIFKEIERSINRIENTDDCPQDVQKEIQSIRKTLTTLNY